MKGLKIIFAGLLGSTAFLCHAEELIVDGGFELAPPGFKIDKFNQSGNWAVRQDMLCAFQGGNARASHDKTGMQYGNFQASLSFDSQGGKAGMIFSVSNEGGSFDEFKGYELLFDSAFSSISLVERTGEPKSIISMPISEASAKWRKIHVMMSESGGLAVYLDSEEVLRLPDLKPLGGTRAGLISYGADAIFKDFYIARPSQDPSGRPILFTGRETPSISAKWRAYPGSEKAGFYHDDESGYESKSSQEFSIKNSFAGIVNRKKLAVKSGEVLKGSLAIKGETTSGKVFLRLINADASKVYAEVEVKQIEGKWRIEEFELRPSADTAEARFAIVFEGSGSVSVDDASLKR